MSKRRDDDSLLAKGQLHIIEALRVNAHGDRAAALEHLALAEKNAHIVLNRGLDQWHPDYLKPEKSSDATTVTSPAEGAP
jgi:hypothetical protein